jgi:hypothetical protein
VQGDARPCVPMAEHGELEREDARLAEKISSRQAGAKPQERAMEIRTSIRSGWLVCNRCEGMKVRTNVKAGMIIMNRCEGMKVRTGVKAGFICCNRCEGMKFRSA